MGREVRVRGGGEGALGKGGVGESGRRVRWRGERERGRGWRMREGGKRRKEEEEEEEEESELKQAMKCGVCLETVDRPITVSACTYPYSLPSHSECLYRPTLSPQSL